MSTQYAEECRTIAWALDYVDMSRLEIDEYLFRAAYLAQIQRLPEAYALPRSVLEAHAEFRGDRNTAKHLDRAAWLRKQTRWLVRRAERDASDNRY